MRNVVFFLMLVALSSALVAADFSGTWVLNEQKSELGEGRSGRMAAAKMVVTQTKETISIETTRAGRDGQERVQTQELTLDGKEKVTKNDRGETASVAKIEGDVLAMTTVRKMERNGETFESTTNQKWELKSETELLVAVKSSSSRGDRELTLVYDKK
jgi:hypothetical protein